MTKALTEQTPVEIDTQIAEIYRRGYEANRQVALHERWLADYQRGYEKLQAGNRSYSSYTAEAVARQEAAHAAALAAADAIWAEADPFEREWMRRGRWSRFYLVTNTSGHVHSSMHCSSCFPTTEFEWLPTYSDMTEAELVAIAGEEACTLCFNSAPSDLKRKSTITSFSREQQAAARAERQAAKDARDAKTAAAAITNPDGTPLKARSYGYIKTERIAEQEAVSLRVSLISAEVQHWGNDEWPTEYQESIEVILAALAHKRGTDIEAQRKIVEMKALAKYIKEHNGATDEHRARLKALKAAAKA